MPTTDPPERGGIPGGSPPGGASNETEVEHFKRGGMPPWRGRGQLHKEKSSFWFKGTLKPI